MIRLYLDENIGHALTDGLRRRGIELVTTHEDTHNKTADWIILDRAEALKCVVFTQDTDFLRIAHERQTRGEAFTGVIYAPQDRTRIGIYLDDLEIIASLSEFDELANRVTYLPL